MAAPAASLITAGAGKSGNPCDRLTPPGGSLRRVISRMTDAVNCVAFFDPVSFDIRIGSSKLDPYSRPCVGAELAPPVADAFFFFFGAGVFADAARADACTTGGASASAMAAPA